MGVKNSKSISSSSTKKGETKTVSEASCWDDDVWSNPEWLEEVDKTAQDYYVSKTKTNEDSTKTTDATNQCISKVAGSEEGNEGEKEVNATRSSTSATTFSETNSKSDKQLLEAMKNRLNEHQYQTLQAILDKRDIFLCSPEFQGHLLYKLAAVRRNQLTLVVSFSVNLMINQVSALQRCGKDRAAYYPHPNKEKNEALLAGIIADQNKSRILFTTWESLLTDGKLKEVLHQLFMNELLVQIVVVDAHRLTEFALSLNADQKPLGPNLVRHWFEGVPILAITEVPISTRAQQLISAKLQLANTVTFAFANPSSYFDDTNVRYEVRKKAPLVKSQIQDIVGILRMYPEESGIIYCATTEECILLEKQLKVQEGLRVGHYMAPNSHITQENWLTRQINILITSEDCVRGVISEAPVSFIIHTTLPKSVNQYLQQTAMARKGAYEKIPALCCIFYQYTDSHEVERLNKQVRRNGYSITSFNLDEMRGLIAYCINPKKCRQNLLMKQLKGEENSAKRKRCGLCNNCAKESVKGKSKDATVTANRILNYVHSLPRGLPFSDLVRCYEGFRCHTLGKATRAEEVEYLIFQMILKGALIEKYVLGERKFLITIKNPLAKITVLLPEMDIPTRNYLLKQDKKKAEEHAKIRAMEPARTISNTTCEKEEEEKDLDEDDDSPDDEEPGSPVFHLHDSDLEEEEQATRTPLPLNPSHPTVPLLVPQEDNAAQQIQAKAENEPMKERKRKKRRSKKRKPSSDEEEEESSEWEDNSSTDESKKKLRRSKKRKRASGKKDKKKESESTLTPPIAFMAPSPYPFQFFSYSQPTQNSYQHSQMSQQPLTQQPVYFIPMPVPAPPQLQQTPQQLQQPQTPQQQQQSQTPQQPQSIPPMPFMYPFVPQYQPSSQQAGSSPPFFQWPGGYFPFMMPQQFPPPSAFPTPPQPEPTEPKSNNDPNNNK